jgi:glycosyltransferase involved in cell wall biosynthesis
VKWICSQVGAREHYAVPRSLHHKSRLDSLYTDFWAGPLWRGFRNFIGPSALFARYHADLENVKVKSFDLTTLTDSLFGGDQKSNPYKWFLYVGSNFGQSIVESLKRRKGVIWKEMIFFGYDTAFLEPARWVKARGGKTIVCQMDPSRIEFDLVKDEEIRWPGWAKRSGAVPEAYFRRREQEWAAADVVIVNSEWTKLALIQQKVNEEKIVIVPLAYEKNTSERKSLEMGGGNEYDNQQSTISSKSRLRVLFLGQVILRKGIQYVIEAARILREAPVCFDVVGPIGISDQAVKSASANVIFHGAIHRDRASDFFGDADVFILPTLSDGFALTQLEAMAYGLPVIATPNCGEVVTDGVDGFIVPAKNAARLAESIRFLIANPEALRKMSAEARRKIRRFTLSTLGENLASLEQRFLSTQ